MQNSRCGHVIEVGITASTHDTDEDRYCGDCQGIPMSLPYNKWQGV